MAHDDEPPMMEEPPEPGEPQDVSLFARVPPPPTGATPLMRLILSAVADPAQREAIEEAAWALQDGDRGDHLMTKAAALLSAVESAHLGRMLAVLAEFREIERQMRLTIRAQRGAAPQQAQVAAAPSLTPEQLTEFGRGVGEAIVDGQEGEFAALRQAAKTANNQRVLAFVAGAFFAGMALAAVLFLIFH